MSRSVELARLIRDRAGAAPPDYGLILGSGLGHLGAGVSGPATIAYADLPGYPAAGVEGQRAQLCIGHIEGRRVAVFCARAYVHESGRADDARLPLEILGELGCDRLLLTDTATSLREDIAAGGLMLMSDHLSLGPNPLVGGSAGRHMTMDDAHDAGIRADLRAAAAAEDVPLPEGVGGWMTGPSFSTPAEARAMRTLGADALCHAAVPEVVLARALGLRCAAIAAITGQSGVPGRPAVPPGPMQQAALVGAAKLAVVLRRFMRD